MTARRFTHHDRTLLTGTAVSPAVRVVDAQGTDDHDDRHRVGADASRHGVCAAQIGRPQGRREREVAGVGYADRLALVVEGDDRADVDALLRPSRVTLPGDGKGPCDLTGCCLRFTLE
jgi:hypothetical protein